MPTSSEYERRLRSLAAEKFGWAHLHDEQLTAMEHIMAGKDVLVVLPTGAGKSAIYQVPALLLDGPAVVVSPLIALQHDQIESIGDSKAPGAVALNSTQSRTERRAAWAALRRGAAEYIFLSPEQLADDDLVDELAGLRASLFVVDEAHCVSAWGHDFRPDYLRLAPVIDRLRHPRVIALTATAAPPVRHEIVHRLGMHDHREVVAGFDRPNLSLAVDRYTGDSEKRDAVIARIRTLTADPATGRGLVYVASRKDSEFYAEASAAAGIRVAAYHAGMKAALRDEVHQHFLSGEVDVVVATSAFGMGIDKPDVRFVVHASAPDSLDSYYQQIGRAGRDGERAQIVLCYRPEDLSLQKFLTARAVPEDTIAEVAHALYRHDRPVRPSQLEVDAAPARRTRAINLLEQVGAITTTATGLLQPDSGRIPGRAVEQAADAARAYEELTRSRIEMMRGYAETTGCRRQHLLGYFGEQLLDPCGNCDTCAAGTAARRAPHATEFPANATVRHRDWGAGTIMSAEADRITVLFDEVGYKTLSLPEVRERHLLSRA
ncbi:RecQ family ATP-dependent DNA helicase [Nocardia sp. CY41]|uniref:RecQ family ATP-dependent DNA helicase n=1 Tax=Nocardia sp. CY41 TaxID=2608686 RepID=UPI001357E98C|nr:RecQ family ATP-dependent DNA helicase [Nocardia sp. CY41]